MTKKFIEGMEYKNPDKEDGIYLFPNSKLVVKIGFGSVPRIQKLADYEIKQILTECTSTLVHLDKLIASNCTIALVKGRGVTVIASTKKPLVTLNSGELLSSLYKRASDKLSSIDSLPDEELTLEETWDLGTMKSGLIIQIGKLENLLKQP